MFLNWLVMKVYDAQHIFQFNMIYIILNESRTSIFAHTLDLEFSFNSLEFHFKNWNLYACFLFNGYSPSPDYLGRGESVCAAGHVNILILTHCHRWWRWFYVQDIWGHLKRYQCKKREKKKYIHKRKLRKENLVIIETCSTHKSYVI